MVKIVENGIFRKKTSKGFHGTKNRQIWIWFHGEIKNWSGEKFSISPSILHQISTSTPPWMRKWKRKRKNSREMSESVSRQVSLIETDSDAYIDEELVYL